MTREDGRYTLSTDEIAALASLLGKQVIVGMHVDAEPDATRGVETLLARGLVTEPSKRTLDMPDALRLCLNTIFDFDVYLSCTGRKGSHTAPTLGIYVLSGTLVALSEEAPGHHKLLWLPVLPLAIGAVAAFADAVDRDDEGTGESLRMPLSDVAEFRVALAEGKADILEDVLGQGGMGAELTAELVEELASGTLRRFVGISAFEALDDLDLTLVAPAPAESE